MYYVYVLKSVNHEWVYIGVTSDLRTRFSRHNEGLVKSTKFYKPLELVYYEAYKTNNLARKREWELKNNNQQKELLYKRLSL